MPGLRAVGLMVQMSPEGQNHQGTFGPCLETFWLSQLGRLLNNLQCTTNSLAPNVNSSEGVEKPCPGETLVIKWTLPQLF